ncbi:MAG TPA: SGNH/GDSL hydrolase family protein [Roseomonas sp.]|jgi:hypothetical protein
MLPLRVVCVGASNSLMVPGYLTQLPECAEAASTPIHIVSNLAIGNTASLTGLHRLASHGNLEDVDVLLIEYALTDTSFYGAERKNLETWAANYEALVRFALLANPKLKIVSIILYNRLGLHRKTIPPLAAGIYYLSDWYGTRYVDLNREFTIRFGADHQDLAGIYTDRAHYSRPIMTRLIAESVASVIAEVAREPSRARRMPPPVDPSCPCDVSILQASEWEELPPQVYRNSRYEVRARDLFGYRAKFQVAQGRLLSILFVCPPGVSRLHARINDVCYELPMLRPNVRDGKFQFLLASANFDMVPSAGNGRMSYELSAVPECGETPVPLPQSGGVFSAQHPETTLPLISLMHTGSVSDVAFSRSARMHDL